MLISEKLYLLMANNHPNPEAVMSQAGYGMNAAVLSDLMIAGRVAFSDDPDSRIQLSEPVLVQIRYWRSRWKSWRKRQSPLLAKQ